MTPKAFLDFIEIKTKTASLFPYAFALMFALHRYGSLDLTNAILMFSSLLLFDMTTTGINNLMDYKKSGDREYRERTNVIGYAGIGEFQAAAYIAVMLAGSTALGLLLVIRTGPVVLVLGAVSFLVGIFYTFGPIPISRMPLGEILSGFFMGFVILFLSVYVHHTSLAAIKLSGMTLAMTIELSEILILFLVSLPFLFAISNLMLANNICDLEQDIEHDRYLLPYYMGVRNSLIIFRISYYAGYLALLAGVALGFLPLLSLATMLTLFPVEKNIRLFCEKQVKEETFFLAVKNLTIISLSYIAPLVLSVLLDNRL